MDIAMLIIGIGLAIAGLLCMYLGPRRVITTAINKVEHEYKTSTDYDRLYDLLMEGREIIIINGDSKYPSLASVSEGYTSYDKVIKRFYGFGINHPLDDCTKEKFILFCQFHEIKYLDQIDKYLTLQDYMKK